MRTIAQVPWPSPWGVHLVGARQTRAGGEALLHLEATGAVPRLALAVVDLAGGAVRPLWEASAASAARTVGAYPTFRGMGGVFEADLARYADLLRRAGPWFEREASPPMGVAADEAGRWILYSRPPDDGRDGDWLMLADRDGRLVGRLGPALRASYYPNFSPSGDYVALVGGAREFARDGRQVGYVLHIARIPGPYAPEPVPQVRDGMRTPVWSKDGRTVYAIGQREDAPFGDPARCLFAVDRATLAARSLSCHPGEIDIVLHPDGAHALVLEQPAGSGAPPAQKTLALVELTQGKTIARTSVRGVQGMGRFGAWVDKEHFAVIARNGRAVVVIEPFVGGPGRAIELGEEGAIRGRHGAAVVDDELIALRQTGDAVEVVGVRVD